MVSNIADPDGKKWMSRFNRLYAANYLLQVGVLVNAATEPAVKVSALYLPAVTLVASVFFHLLTIYLLRIGFEAAAHPK